MYIEIGARQSGKTEVIIQETIRILKENPHNEVCIIGANRNICDDISFRLRCKLTDGRIIKGGEYNRISLYNINSPAMLKFRDFRKYHTTFFDEVYHMKDELIMPLKNGYYTGTPTTKESLLRIARHNDGNYNKRTRVCRISKKTTNRKTQNNI